MKNKYRFKIGDVVNVKASAYTDYIDGKNEKKLCIDVFKKPLLGQIVGIKRLCTGIYIPSSGSGYGVYPDDDPPSFRTKGQVYLWKVVLGMVNKPFFARDEDVELALDCSKFIVPLFYNDQPEWKEQWKKEQRDIMKDHPRDSKGRWIKSQNEQR